MSRVDPDDDSIERFVVRRYTFVRARRQHRWVTVAAFDNFGECSAFASQLAAHQTTMDHRNRVGEAYLEAGHYRKRQNGRLVRRAIVRRANLDDATWDQLARDLPSNVGLLRLETGPPDDPT